MLFIFVKTQLYQQLLITMFVFLATCHVTLDNCQLWVPGDTGTVVLQFYIVLKLVFSIWHELVLGLVDNVAIRQRKQVAIKTECRPPPAAAADNVEEWTRTRQNMTNNCGVTVGPHFVLFLINIWLSNTFHILYKPK